MSFLFATAAATTQRRGIGWLRQLRVQLRRPGDFLFRGTTYLLVLAALAIVAGVAWVLVSNSWLDIRLFGFSFLTNQAFDPIHNTFGVGPAIFGTIVTSVFGLLFSVPLGIGTAIFLVEFCPRAIRLPLSFIVDLLAAIPSVVLALWGAFVMVPSLQLTVQPWLQKHLGFLPFFQGEIHGYSLMAAGLLLIVMTLPIVTALSREVMLVVPNSQREAMLALGATRWEVIRYAVLPFSRAGIAGAVLLGFGRALGETIAVTAVVGNQASPIGASLFSTGYTLSSVIANQFGEATPGAFYSALLETGLLLLIITLIVNILARLLISRLGRVGGLIA